MDEKLLKKLEEAEIKRSEARILKMGHIRKQEFQKAAEARDEERKWETIIQKLSDQLEIVEGADDQIEKELLYIELLKVKSELYHRLIQQKSPLNENEMMWDRKWLRKQLFGK